MQLDNLKPAWQRCKILNAMEHVDREAILVVLHEADHITASKPYRSVIAAAIFVFLTMCCQGG